MTVKLRRRRMCESRHARPLRAGRWWDAVRRAHTSHVCDRTRSFSHEHRGGHVCECGVRWA